jgi:predicted MFS family arabinose efflux permease
MGPRFWRAFGAYSINTVGDEFYLLALPLVLLELGYPVSTATFLRAALMATTVVAGFVIGYVVDRWATGRLLTMSYLASGAVLAAAIGAVLAGADGYIAGLLAAAVLGLLAAVSAAAMDAGVPRLVEAGEVRRAYSLVESARTAATLLGPALAGLVTSTRSVVLVMGVNSVSFLLAGLVTTNKGAVQERVQAGGASAWRQIAEGLRTVAHHRQLRLGISMSLLVNVTLGAEQPLFLVLLVRDFQLSTTVTSVIVMAAGITSIAASTALTHLAGRFSARATMFGSVVAIALTAAGIGLVGSVVVAAVLYCVLCAATIAYVVHWRTFRQEIVPIEQLGRVSATCRSLAYAGVVAGTLAIGALQETGLGTRSLLVGGGLLCLGGAVVVAVALRRDSETPHVDSPVGRGTT